MTEFKGEWGNGVSVGLLDRTKFAELGNQLYAAELYGHAHEFFKLAAIEGSSPQTELRLAQCEIRMGKPLQAERRARRLLQRHVRAAFAWLLLAECLIAQSVIKAAF